MSATPHFAPRRQLRLRGVAWRIVGDVGRVRSRRTAAGEVRYYLDFRPLGRVYSVRDALGEQPLTSQADAEKLLARIRARVEDGQALETVLGLLRPDGASTVERRAAAWLAAKRLEAEAGQITAASLERMEGEVRRYWGPWEGLAVRAIRASHLADWSTWLHQGGLAPVTVRAVLGTFRGFLGWLHEREEVERIPRLPSVKVPERVPRLMAPDAQERVLAAIPEPRRGIFLFLVDLAVRPNEARAVALADFELRDGVPWVWVRRAYKGQHVSDPIGHTKTRRVRDLPVTDRVWEWIERHANRGEPLAPLFRHSRGAPWSAWALNRAWRRACKRAKVNAAPVRESTRHSTSTRWLNTDGVRLEDVRDALGHRDTRTTEIYAKRDRTKLARLVRR